MGKQSGVLQIEGNIGNLSFYASKDGYMVRQKKGVSKSRIMSDPKFKRTRENMSEFQAVAHVSRFVRKSLHPIIVRSADSKVSLRMHRELSKVQKSDPVSIRGQRRVELGDWTMLKDFEFNKNNGVESTIKVLFSVENTTDEIEVAIEEFNPQETLKIPEGATHVRFFIYGAALDFENNERQLARVDSPGTELTQGTIPGGITLTLPKTPLTYSHRLFVFGVEFYQLSNGEEYLLNSEAYNGAKVLEAENLEDNETLP